MKKLVVLTGAGISAESGLKTFRDSNGLWEGHNVMEVATPQGFANNPRLVLEFYNQRRKQLKEVSPNKAHFDLALAEQQYKVTIITQNVDDLHERAGSTRIIHLHGELLKAESSVTDEVISWEKDLNVGDLCNQGHQLRPHIVWFGEDVPLMEKAMQICEEADLLIIVGTSMQVYPAANLIHYVPQGIPIYYIDPSPATVSMSSVQIIKTTATNGVSLLLNQLKKEKTMKTTPKHNQRIAKMSFASVYPHYVSKVEKNGRTKEELHQLIEWLTGFSQDEVQKYIDEKATFEKFFNEATLNSNAHLIKGVICGYRIEEIDNPLTQKVRYLDKIIEELARGRKMEKIMRGGFI